MRLLFLAFSLASAVAGSGGSGTTCVACGLVFTLLEQLGTNGSKPTGGNPDATCQLLGFCDGQCPLFNSGNTWPVASPLWPTDGGVVDQRRRRLEASLPAAAVAAAPSVTTAAAVAFLKTLAAVEAAAPGRIDFFSLWTTVASFFASGGRGSEGRLSHAASSRPAALRQIGPCDDILNISCDILRVEDHLPLDDSDGDAFAGAPAGLLSNGFRGASWRGRDCNDLDETIYPGRRYTTHGPDVDHNCNGYVHV